MSDQGIRFSACGELCPPHYWDVTVTNHAVCRKCGTEKQFETVELPTVFIHDRWQKRYHLWRNPLREFE